MRPKRQRSFWFLCCCFLSAGYRYARPRVDPARLQPGSHACIEGKRGHRSHLRRIRTAKLVCLVERVERQSRIMDTRDIGNTLVQYGSARITAKSTFVTAWNDWRSVYRSMHCNMPATLTEDDAPHSVCTHHLAYAAA